MIHALVAGITAAAAELALHVILVKGFETYSFQQNHGNALVLNPVTSFVSHPSRLCA